MELAMLILHTEAAILPNQDMSRNQNQKQETAGGKKVLTHQLTRTLTDFDQKECGKQKHSLLRVKVTLTFPDSDTH